MRDLDWLAAYGMQPLCLRRQRLLTNLLCTLLSYSSIDRQDALVKRWHSRTMPN